MEDSDWLFGRTQEMLTSWLDYRIKSSLLLCTKLVLSARDASMLPWKQDLCTVFWISGLISIDILFHRLKTGPLFSTALCIKEASSPPRLHPGREWQVGVTQGPGHGPARLLAGVTHVY